MALCTVAALASTKLPVPLFFAQNTEADSLDRKLLSISNRMLADANTNPIYLVVACKQVASESVGTTSGIFFRARADLAEESEREV